MLNPRDSLRLVGFLGVGAIFASGLGAADPNYRDALTKSVLFYDAQRCGPDVEDGNYFSWRKNCHTQDRSLDGSIDMTGGYHDAGDYLKMGLTQSFVPSTIGYALFEYRSAFDGAGCTPKTLSTLKRFTDYFIKCYQPNPAPGKFWYHIGLDVDHDAWRLPESDTGNRTCPNDGNAYWADSTHGASDICGLTAAALAQMSLNYRSTDGAYADKCLATAQQIYALGKAKLGTGRSNQVNDFYHSSGYYDDLAWAGVWLYVATNNSAYLTEAKSNIGKSTKGVEGALGWDNVSSMVYLKLYQLTGDVSYRNQVKVNVDAFKNAPRTPGGLPIYDGGDPLLAYDCSEAFVSLHYGKVTGDTSYKSMAKLQLDYILGANPKSTALGENWSYMIGFGSGTWTQYVPHPALNGDMDWDGLEVPAKHTLTGAIIGGPTKYDTYNDAPVDGAQSEPAMDYNAGCVAALAAYLGSSAPTSTYTITASAGANGCISPKGSISVTSGGSQTFAITTNAGYAVDTVIVDGSSQGAISTYTFSSVIAKHTISATFKTASSTSGLLSMGKTAKASSNESSSYAAKKAFDGSTSTRWSSAFSDPQWIYVDLGAAKTITKVVLNWEEAYGKAYQIQFSNDASTWTPVATVSNGTGGVVTFNVTGKGRYVRMNGTARGTSYGYSLHEFQVYGY